MWSTSIQKQLVGHVIHLVAKVTHQIRMDLNCWCLKKINRGHRSGMCTSAANILLGVSMPTDRNYRFFSPSSHASLFLHPSPTSPVSLDLCGWRHWPVILFPMSSSWSSPYLSSLLFHVSIVTSGHLLSLWSRWSHSESQWVTFFLQKICAHPSVDTMRRNPEYSSWDFLHFLSKNSQEKRTSGFTLTHWSGKQTSV